MSTANAGFTDSGEIEAHLALAWLGPTLRVQIGFDAEYTGSTPPQLPAKFYPALVDTGAATECIDSELAEELNLPVVDEVQIAGVQGVSTVNLYLAQIHVPDLEGVIYERFSGVHLAAGGQPHVALLGRTFLQNFTMTYEGRTGSVTISDA